MKWINYKKRIFRRIGKSLGKIGIFAGVICFAFYGISILGGTSSYFNDTEDSSANTFSAGTLDFSLSLSVGFSPTTINKGESTIRTINLNQDGSLDFQYSIKIDNLSGGACNYLNLTASLDGTDISYIGLIKDFTYGPITFSAPEEWIFTVTLQTDAPDSVQGEICNFDFVFNGTQIGGNGFYDQEIINNNVAVKYWNPPVVLNEFLPNAGEYPEFIEIYNQTGESIDLSGFYIMASDEIPINTTTTADYSSGSTIIPANGWLVVTTGGDLINNTSGTITLYNPNDVVVDAYAYGVSENNANNTPGWTNNLVAYLPFDTDGLDKSGNSNDSTINGAIFTNGKINQGLSFDGVNDYVEVIHSDSLNISGDKITLEAWINLSSLPAIGGKYIILNKYNAYALLVADGGKARVWLGPLTSYVETSGIEVSAGSWTHLVGTYDGSDVKIYVNGLLKKQVSKTGDQATSANNLMLATNKVFASYMNGLIDEVKIYNRALSSTEILDHYNAVGTGSSVPVDKSYARIPDGSSNWIDPVPTPGQPNILEEQTEIINQNNIEEKSENIDSDEIIEKVADQLLTEEITEEEIITETIEIIEPITNEEEEPSIITEESPITEEILATEELLIPEEQTIVEEQETDQLPTPEEVTTEELITEELITEEIIIEETIEDVPVQESIIETEPIIEPEPVIIEELIDEEPISSE